MKIESRTVSPAEAAKAAKDDLVSFATFPVDAFRKRRSDPPDIPYDLGSTVSIPLIQGRAYPMVDRHTKQISEKALKDLGDYVRWCTELDRVRKSMRKYMDLIKVRRWCDAYNKRLALTKARKALKHSRALRTKLEKKYGLERGGKK